MFRHRSSYQKKRKQSHARARIGMILMLCAAIAATALPPLTAGASAPALDGAVDGTQTTDLTVTISAVEEINPDYRQITGTMSGTLQRNDGSSGSYKVPMLVIYPHDAGVCNNVGVVDIVNSAFYETFPTFAEPAIQAVRAIVGDNFLQSRGYVYASAQWNKLVIERQRDLGVLEDDSLHIDEGPDSNVIFRDLSHVLRAPSSFFAAEAQIPCASDDVIGFGYSQTGMLLREFTFAGLNNQLAGAPVFDDGLVFEGAMHGGPGSHCRRAETISLWYSYTFDGCTGATPADQGKVMTVNTATDVQIVGGWRSRPEDDSSDAYYRVYEITGTSHLPEGFLPLKATGFRDAAHSDQNYADPFPVFRAMFEHLRAWIQEDQAPPSNAVIEGTVGTIAQPLFSSASASGSSTDVFVESTGPDGNPLGGIRLPHLRTTLDNGRQIGAPLGVYRGTHCNNDPIPATFILDCQLSGDAESYNIIGGTFTPYTAFDASTCAAFYGNPGRYTSAVNTAVGYAIAQGWVLPEERRAIVNAAEARAEDHLDCVSESASGMPAQHTTTAVTTHPSQGDVTVVDGATASLTSNDVGITVRMRTTGLEIMHAHTLWVVTIDRPDLCLTSPCTPEDIINRSDIVESNIVYGGGRVVRSHTTPFMAHLPAGEVEGGWYENAFSNPRSAEIHLVINDHGPIIPGLTLEMTRTYRAGCTDASIPAIFPPAAFADGTPGSNQCRLVQVAVFQQ